LPSIASNYLYSFVALLAVSTLLVGAFSYYTSTLRAIPEIEQLKNILDHVVAKGNELLTLAITINTTVSIVVQLPSTIGLRQYWIQVRNDTSNAWLEGALGSYGESGTTYKVFFPGKASTLGHYISGYGPALLECYMNGSIPQLNLGSQED
jgi:hypothetical protein